MGRKAVLVIAAWARGGISYGFLSGVCACAFLFSEPARALTVRDYPEFIEITAVEPLEDGTFVVAGWLRSSPDSTVASGFLRISSSGEPQGAVVELPPPDADHPNATVRDLKRLPSGDLIASGWAFGKDVNPDAWLIRFGSSGNIVWNRVRNSDWEEKLYAVKLLSSGRLMAVGRSQEDDKNKPARGLAMWIDPETGEASEDANTGESLEKQFGCDQGSSRCAFQDVTELADGSLIFAGWSTKDDRTDDIWLLRTDAAGNQIKSTTFGESENDVAFAIASVEDTVLVAGTETEGKGRKPVLAVFNAALSHKTPVSLSVQGEGRVQVLEPLAYAKRFLIGGWIAEGGSSTTKAFIASQPSKGTHATVDEVVSQATASEFSGIAVNSDGTVVMAGKSGTGSDQRGLVAFRAGAKLCPADQPLETLAIDQQDTRNVIACATSTTPARLQIAGTKPDSAILVRPLLGDIDALFQRGEVIVDSSLNRDFAPELLILPTDTTDLELSVSTATPLAAFIVSVAEPVKTLEVALYDDLTVDNEEQRLVDFALSVLGYDVAGEAIADISEMMTYDRRAILAFQASENMTLTGALGYDERKILFARAAGRAATLAREAASDGFEAAKSDSLVNLLPKFRGVFQGDYVQAVATPASIGGNYYGAGLFSSGSTFYGLWQGDLQSHSSPVLGELWVPVRGAPWPPGLGGFRVAPHCGISLYAADRFDPVSNFEDLLAKSLGVLYQDGTIKSSGRLSSFDVKSACPASPKGVAKAGSIAIELVKLEPQGQACGIHLNINNMSSTEYEQLKLEFVLSQFDGERRDFFTLGSLKANNREVVFFRIEDNACDEIRSLMIDDVTECRVEAAPIGHCLVDIITSSSVINVQLVAATR